MNLENKLYLEQAELKWDEYFMSIAELTALRSRDPSTRVGSCVVSKDHIIISTGYNGMPRGIEDFECNWSSTNADHCGGTKYDYIVHSEMNSILNSGGRSLKGAIIYTTLFPCCECAKAIIQSGISEVVYLNKPEGKPHLKFDVAAEMFMNVGIICRKFQGKLNVVVTK